MKYHATLGLCSALLFALSTPAFATSISLNARPLMLAESPITEDGRIFVPLRSIFEALGASVVYQDGVITATKEQRTVELRIGSKDATVSGDHEYLDATPFVQNNHTYVPLRFIAQSLGANVRYDNASDSVAIETAFPKTVKTVPVSDIRILTAEPGRLNPNTSVRPIISARFSRAVDPDSLKVRLDDLDVTGESTRSSSGIVYEPPSPLQNMVHKVDVSGLDTNHRRFHLSWNFTTGVGMRSVPLSIDTLQNGDVVAQSFFISGRTAPNAHLRIVCVSNGEFRKDARADAKGHFTQHLVTNARPGDAITLTVTTSTTAASHPSSKVIQLQAGFS